MTEVRGSSAFMKLLGPGTVIAEQLEELPPSADRAMARAQMSAAIDQAIKKGGLEVFAIIHRVHRQTLQIPPVLLISTCRLPEDEAANDGRIRYPVAVEPLDGRATLDIRAANLILQERPDLVRDVDRVRPPPPGVIRPTPDDEISRFVTIVQEKVWVPTGRTDFEVKVSQAQAISVLAQLMQELCSQGQKSDGSVRRPSERTKATDEQHRLELEKSKAKYEAADHLMPGQRERRDEVTGSLRAQGLIIDRAIFGRLDREMFPRPVGRPPKATPRRKIP
jgi:hypothetical protein